VCDMSAVVMVDSGRRAGMCEEMDVREGSDGRQKVRSGLERVRCDMIEE